MLGLSIKIDSDLMDTGNPSSNRESRENKSSSLSIIVNPLLSLWQRTSRYSLVSRSYKVALI